MIAKLTCDEWYPVYGLEETGYGWPVEVPEELYREWREVSEKFDAIQKKLRAYEPPREERRKHIDKALAEWQAIIQQETVAG